MVLAKVTWRRGGIDDTTETVAVATTAETMKEDVIITTVEIMEVMKEDVEMAFVLPLCETGFKFVEKCIEKSERKRYKRNIFRDGVHDEKGERVVIGFL